MPPPNSNIEQRNLTPEQNTQSKQYGGSCAGCNMAATTNIFLELESCWGGQAATSLQIPLIPIAKYHLLSPFPHRNSTACFHTRLEGSKLSHLCLEPGLNRCTEFHPSLDLVVAVACKLACPILFICSVCSGSICLASMVSLSFSFFFF